MAPPLDLPAVKLPHLVTTSSTVARDAFHRALYHQLNFNHEEGILLYKQAQQADPAFAMAYWGEAYCLSSSYNFPPGLGCGYDAIQEGLKHVDKVSEIERDLITALAKRSSAEAKAGIDPTKMNFGNSPELNVAFGNAMKEVYKKYGDNHDVAAIYIEALMNVNPWKLWVRNNETGEVTAADANTPLIVSTLEKHLADAVGAQHPGLNHLYIHAMELSSTPEKALPAANRLRNLVPEGGHLLHMPSHIDAWVGQYREGIECNLRGVEADDAFAALPGRSSNFYKLYRLHNHHFVSWMACFDGQYDTAIEYANRLCKYLPPGDNGVEFMLAGIIPLGSGFLEAYASTKWHVWIRFGKWEEILNEPVPDEALFAVSNLMAHYARGIAFASTNQVAAAEEEQKLMLEQSTNAALKGRVLHNNPIVAESGAALFPIAREMLAGEIEYRKENYDAAFKHLRTAVSLDASLNYDEPWGWMVPARHALGALLLEQGHAEEAEQVYRHDLKQYKDNLWGLLGLRKALEADGTEKHAEEIAALRSAYTTAAARSVYGEDGLQHTCFCAGVKKCCA